METIGQLAQRTGTSRRMLRHWEAQGLLVPAAVDPWTKQRRYASAQAGRVRAIAALREVGFGLDAIRDLLDQGLTEPRLLELLRDRESELAARIAQDSTALERVRTRLRSIERDRSRIEEAVALAAVPALVLVVLVLSVWGNTWPLLGMATGLALAPRLHQAVVQRLEVLQHDDYVLAMRAHGVPELELWLGHLLVGAAGPALLRALLRGLALVLVLECTLSYLGGLGVQEPWPSWGNMLAFEWGHSWGPAVWAPVAALLATLWACQAATALVEDPDHG